MFSVCLCCPSGGYTRLPGGWQRIRGARGIIYRAEQMSMEGYITSSAPFDVAPAPSRAISSTRLTSSRRRDLEVFSRHDYFSQTWQAFKVSSF